MIKIEKLSKDARVLVTRNGNRGQAFVGQLISHNDWQTVEVIAGEVTYSIDEGEVRTMVAPIKDAEIKTVELGSETTKVIDSVTATATAPKKIVTRNATVKK